MYRMLCLYNTYTDNLFCQGHDSAPGLDIMLLKQQHLSVSGQAADPMIRRGSILLLSACTVVPPSQPSTVTASVAVASLAKLTRILAEWIANNYAAELTR